MSKTIRECLVTPVTNVDFLAREVKDSNLITVQFYKEFEEVEIFDTRKKEKRTISISQISLYDHHIMIAGLEYKVLQMITKPIDI